MSVREYSLRTKAFTLDRIEEARNLHLLAFLNRSVQATNKKGEYIYQSFKDFFDEDKMFEEVDDDKKRQKRVVFGRMAEIAMNVNKKGG